MENYCPIRSVGAKSPVQCNENCAWYDTGEEQCVVFVTARELNELIESVGGIERQISSNS